MENLIEQVNEKFLKAILELQDPTGLDILMSAYLNFAHATRAMQDYKGQAEEVGDCG